ncbi:hydrogenase/urease nickel incorporation protein HypA [uncultured Helicobacter sp.]|uniref:hydrogenase/urease nickel incorporation protein HypA n=2 Tax=uncultured Helicobacter sp. TaxID=175537 RepID=UPI00375121BF
MRYNDTITIGIESMHELSIVNALLEQACEIATQHNASKVHKIIISVGERSGVDMGLLARTFETFRTEFALCENALLESVYERVEVLCEDCQTQSVAQDMQYAICPHCQSRNVRIVKGKELLLLSLELDSQE